jgi:hypothetical protein
MFVECLFTRKRVSYRVGLQESTSYIFVPQETCSVTTWFPTINLYGNVFVNSFPSNGRTCHNNNSESGIPSISLLWKCNLSDAPKDIPYRTSYRLVSGVLGVKIRGF